MYDDLVKRLRDAAKISEALAVLLPHSEGNATAKLYNDAADAIEELSRENESLAKSVNEASEILRKRWIPVEEKPPEKNEDVLCFTSENEMFIATYMGIFGGDIVFDDGEGSAWLGDITHWMPQPEPPSEVAK